MLSTFVGTGVFLDRISSVPLSIATKNILMVFSICVNELYPYYILKESNDVVCRFVAVSSKQAKRESARNAFKCTRSDFTKCTAVVSIKFIHSSPGHIVLPLSHSMYLQASCARCMASFLPRIFSQLNTKCILCN